MQIQDIKPDLMVHAKSTESATRVNCGLYVGTVDRVELEGFIKLKRDGAPDGRCHWIPLAWVEDVDDKAVYLNKTSEEFAGGLLDAVPRLLH